MNQKIKRRNFARQILSVVLLMFMTFYFVGLSTIEADSKLPVRTFKVWQAGQLKSYNISAATVGDALDVLNLEYVPMNVYPAVDTKLKDGMRINIVNSDMKIEEKLEKVPFKIIRENDNDLPRGRTKVVKKGIEGKNKVLYRIIMVGNTKLKKVLYTEEIEPAVNEVIKIGTGANILETSRGTIRYTKVMDMEATAYTLAEGNGDGVTSIGIVPYRGIIAVDPKVIPYGTRVYIPEYGFAMAGDCGGAIQGNRIDCFMEKYNDAIQFGRRQVKMYILE